MADPREADNPSDDWWCEHCQSDDHPQDSTLCPWLPPETVEWLKSEFTKQERAAAARTLASAPVVHDPAQAQALPWDAEDIEAMVGVCERHDITPDPQFINHLLTTLLGPHPTAVKECPANHGPQCCGFPSMCRAAMNRGPAETREEG